jgi:hypothetical protein
MKRKDLYKMETASDLSVTYPTLPFDFDWLAKFANDEGLQIIVDATLIGKANPHELSFDRWYVSEDNAVLKQGKRVIAADWEDIDQYLSDDAIKARKQAGTYGKLAPTIKPKADNWPTVGVGITRAYGNTIFRWTIESVPERVSRGEIRCKLVTDEGTVSTLAPITIDIDLITGRRTTRMDPIATTVAIIAIPKRPWLAAANDERNVRLLHDGEKPAPSIEDFCQHLANILYEQRKSTLDIVKSDAINAWRRMGAVAERVVLDKAIKQAETGDKPTWNTGP